MIYLLVGIGGASGSIARFVIGKTIAKKTKASFPFGTFAINILGALLLGIVSNIHSSANMYLFLGDGFLGGFTTFSTFMYEGFHLFENNEKWNASVYIGVSLILGISGYILGSFLVGYFRFL